MAKHLTRVSKNLNGTFQFILWIKEYLNPSYSFSGRMAFDFNTLPGTFDMFNIRFSKLLGTRCYDGPPQKILYFELSMEKMYVYCFISVLEII